MASSLYEAWVTRLRVSWMGAKARGIFGGFAAVLGDKTYDYALQGTLEHLPATASAQSLALIASERQLETDLGEAAASIASREPYAAAIHRFDGTPLRVLLGLHFAGLDGAIVVQQNGRVFSLTLPLPAFADGWDPKPNLVVANATTLSIPLTSALKPGRSIPAGTPWLSLADIELTNRFAVIYPSWPFSSLSTAVFNNSDSAVVTWPVPFGSTSYGIIIGPPSDSVVLTYDMSTQAKGSVTIRASAPWSGVVYVIGYATGISPLNFFSSESASLLQKTIAACRPEKTYCAGVYAYLTTKGAWGYPIRKWGNGDKWGATSVSQILGSF